MKKNLFDVMSGVLYDAERSGSNIVSLQNDDFYVSYLADSSFGPETALWLKTPPSGGHFWILLGDHRDGFGDAYKAASIAGLMDYFKSHIDEASDWSEHAFKD